MQLDRGVSALTQRGETAIARGAEPLRTLITVVAVQLVDQILAELDLTALVRERVDLIGLADEIIDGVDLPRIIRESTTSITADVMTDVRSQGERADDMVSGIVDRMLGRTDRSDRSDR